MLLIGSIVLALLLLSLDAPAPAGFVFLIGVVVQSIPARYTVGQSPTRGKARARRQTRREANYTYREAAGLLTKEEIAAERAEENAVHDKRHRDAGWQSGQWKDHNGDIRDYETGEIVYRRKR